MMMRAFTFVMMLAALTASGGTASAQEQGVPDVPGIEAEALPQVVTVLGHDVVPKKGLFEVTSDLNVRDGPGTDFQRIDSLKEGERVRAVGASDDGQWVAVSRGGDILGFVYAPVLIAVVDGTLEEEFFGSFSSASEIGVACDYRFRFEGKTEVQGADFETADYEVRFRCASREGAAISYGHMFLTEGPVIERKGLHLIGLDMRSIGDGMAEYLSTSFLYHPKTGELKFDGHTLPRYALPPETQDFKTKNLKEALVAALEASMSSWTMEAWDTLFTMAAKYRPGAVDELDAEAPDPQQ